MSATDTEYELFYNLYLHPDEAKARAEHFICLSATRHTRARSAAWLER